LSIEAPTSSNTNNDTSKTNNSTKKATEETTMEIRENKPVEKII
jgi:hypothetical protein